MGSETAFGISKRRFERKQKRAANPYCLCCCRPKSEHIGRDLQCAQTVYFIANPTSEDADHDRI